MPTHGVWCAWSKRDRPKLRSQTVDLEKTSRINHSLGHLVSGHLLNIYWTLAMSWVLWKLVDKRIKLSYLEETFKWVAELETEFWSIFFNKFIYLIYLFFAALGLRCCMWAFSSCIVWASHCGGFSTCGARALGTQASVVVARGFQ